MSHPVQDIRNIMSHPVQDIRNPLLQVLSPYHPKRLDSTGRRPGLPFGVLCVRLVHAAAVHRGGVWAGGGACALQISLPRHAGPSPMPSKIRKLFLVSFTDCQFCVNVFV